MSKTRKPKHPKRPITFSQFDVPLPLVLTSLTQARQARDKARRRLCDAVLDEDCKIDVWNRLDAICFEPIDWKPKLKQLESEFEQAWGKHNPDPMPYAGVFRIVRECVEFIRDAEAKEVNGITVMVKRKPK